jgi:hypothetical protein
MICRVFAALELIFDYRDKFLRLDSTESALREFVPHRRHITSLLQGFAVTQSKLEELSFLANCAPGNTSPAIPFSSVQ